MTTKFHYSNVQEQKRKKKKTLLTLMVPVNRIANVQYVVMMHRSIPRTLVDLLEMNRIAA